MHENKREKDTIVFDGLVETRARAAGDVERLTRLLDELGAKLREAQATLNACDTLIRKFHSRLDPEAIEAVHARRLYGTRGNLTDALLEVIKARCPGEVTTTRLLLR